MNGNAKGLPILGIFGTEFGIAAATGLTGKILALNLVAAGTFGKP